jgi:hypothetical protein
MEDKMIEPARSENGVAGPTPSPGGATVVTVTRGKAVTCGLVEPFAHYYREPHAPGCARNQFRLRSGLHRIGPKWSPYRCPSTAWAVELTEALIESDEPSAGGLSGRSQ